MSSQPTRQLRRERRAAALAERRSAPRQAAGEPRRIGIGLVSVIALAAGLLLIAAVLILGGQPKAIPISVVKAAAPAGIPSAGHVLGNAAAPVTIDLYEDFQCPACERWSQNVFPSIVRNELAAGSVKIVFHGFAFIGPESKDAHKAAWAAEQQGRFWDMWSTLYANQGVRENGGAFARDRLMAMAETLGLDMARFTADFDSAAAAASVSDGVAAAAAAGVNSTPTLVINGTRFTGSTYPDVSAAIAAATAP
jgi:protein-disulfide isomerase